MLGDKVKFKIERHLPGSGSSMIILPLSSDHEITRDKRCACTDHLMRLIHGRRLMVKNALTKCLIFHSHTGLHAVSFHLLFGATLWKARFIIKICGKLVDWPGSVPSGIRGMLGSRASWFDSCVVIYISGYIQVSRKWHRLFTKGKIASPFSGLVPLRFRSSPNNREPGTGYINLREGE